MGEPIRHDDVAAGVALAPCEPRHEVGERERESDAVSDEGDGCARREAKAAALEELFNRLANARGAEGPTAWRSISRPAFRHVRSNLGRASRVAPRFAPRPTSH